MQTPPGQLTAPPLQTLLKDGALTGEWVLDSRTSSIRLKSTSMWGLVRVNGVFREVSGNGTVSADGEVSGTVTVAATSIDTNNTRRDTRLTWNLMGMVSMNNTLTIHAVFTQR